MDRSVRGKEKEKVCERERERGREKGKGKEKVTERHIQSQGPKSKFVPTSDSGFRDGLQ